MDAMLYTVHTQIWHLSLHIHGHKSRHTSLSTYRYLTHRYWLSYASNNVWIHDIIIYYTFAFPINRKIQTPPWAHSMQSPPGRSRLLTGAADVDSSIERICRRFVQFKKGDASWYNEVLANQRSVHSELVVFIRVDMNFLAGTIRSADRFKPIVP